MSQKKDDWIATFSVLGCLFILLIVSAFTSVALAWSTKDELTISVQKKERINQPTGQYKNYFIHTDGEVFACENSLAYWNFHNEEIFDQMDVGKTYTISVSGWRVSWLGWHRNIIKAEESTIP